MSAPQFTSAQRRVLSALAESSPRELRLFPASTVRRLEALGLVRIEWRGSEARCPRSGVMVHTALPAHLHLTDAGRAAASGERHEVRP